MTASSRIQPGRFLLQACACFVCPTRRRHEVETVPVKICRLEEVVEESGGQRVLLSLAGIGDIARRKDHVRHTIGVAETPHGSHERAQDDIAVGGITAAEMKIRNVQPGDVHHPERLTVTLTSSVAVRSVRRRAALRCGASSRRAAGRWYHGYR